LTAVKEKPPGDDLTPNFIIIPIIGIEDYWSLRQPYGLGFKPGRGQVILFKNYLPALLLLLPRNRAIH